MDTFVHASHSQIASGQFVRKIAFSHANPACILRVTKVGYMVVHCRPCHGAAAGSDVASLHTVTVNGTCIASSPSEWYAWSRTCYANSEPRDISRLVILYIYICMYVYYIYIGSGCIYAFVFLCPTYTNTNLYIFLYIYIGDGGTGAQTWSWTQPPSSW